MYALESESLYDNFCLMEFSLFSYKNEFYLTNGCLLYTSNWGLIGLFNFNLVEAVFGDALLSAIIYMIVGIAGIINIMLLFTDLDR